MANARTSGVGPGTNGDLNISNNNPSRFPTNGNHGDENLAGTNTNMKNETSCVDANASNSDLEMSIEEEEDVI